MKNIINMIKILHTFCIMYEYEYKLSSCTQCLIWKRTWEGKWSITLLLLNISAYVPFLNFLNEMLRTKIIVILLKYSSSTRICFNIVYLRSSGLNFTMSQY